MTTQPLSPVGDSLAQPTAPIPRAISYTPKPPRLTNGQTTPAPGSPAADFNELDDFIERTLMPYLEALRQSLGVRVHNGTTWVQVPVYISVDDPASLAEPPPEPYVWLQAAVDPTVSGA